MAVLPPDPIFCLKNDMGHVHHMCFDTNDNDYTENLYASTESGFVYIWDLNRNRLKYKQNLGKSIQAIHITYNNKLITQEKEGILKMWDNNEGVISFLSDLNYYGGFCKSKLVKNQLIIPNNSSLELINIDDFVTIQKYNVKEIVGSVMCIELIILNDKPYILAGYESGDIILFDFNMGKICSRIKLRECVTSLTFDSISKRGLAGNMSNILELFTIGDDLSIRLKCEINIVNDSCTVVKIRPDKKIFVSGGLDARLRIYSWKSLRTLAVLCEHKQSITDIQFTPKNVKTHNSKLMACSSADGGISLWNLYN